MVAVSKSVTSVCRLLRIDTFLYFIADHVGFFFLAAYRNKESGIYLPKCPYVTGIKSTFFVVYRSLVLFRNLNTTEVHQYWVTSEDQVRSNRNGLRDQTDD